MLLKIGPSESRLRAETIEVGCLSEASQAYSRIRDESCEGASTFPEGQLAGQRDYRISYNGKIWDGDEVVYNPYA